MTWFPTSVMSAYRTRFIFTCRIKLKHSIFHFTRSNNVFPLWLHIQTLWLRKSIYSWDGWHSGGALRWPLSNFSIFAAALSLSLESRWSTWVKAVDALGRLWVELCGTRLPPYTSTQRPSRLSHDACCPFWHKAGLTGVFWLTLTCINIIINEPLWQRELNAPLTTTPPSPLQI